MNKRMLVLTTLVLVYFTTSINAAENMEVTILDRQSHAEAYTFIIPGYSTTTTNASGSVAGSKNSAFYSESGSSTTISAPGSARSYQVVGSTLSLKLPDGRIVVVNCNQKINWGHVDRYRSCRVPLINNIQAEFNGDNAKLKWPVSIDGKKIQQETYKILGILGREESPQ